MLHARAVFKNDLNMWRTQKIKSIFEMYADKIVAIDDTVAASLPVDKKLVVIHNSFSMDSALAKGEIGFREKLLKIPKRRMNIGYIGAIHHNKGIFDLLNALKLCRENHLDINLIIAGNGNAPKHNFISRWLNSLGIIQDKNEELNSFIIENKLEEFIHPIGFSTNTAEFFKYIDVLCFPTHYNTVGRPVFEAAFYKKPSIVAISNPYPDTFIEGKTGIKVKERALNLSLML